MILTAIESIGLLVLIQSLFTLAVSAAIAILIWYACRREGKPFARSDSR